jgi:hypothetical protein
MSVEMLDRVNASAAPAAPPSSQTIEKVVAEPVSTAKSLLSGKRRGNFSIWALFSGLKGSQAQ